MPEGGEVTVHSRVLWLPKAGNRDAEYEDAFALSPPTFSPFRAAIADGATESVFARTWAELLTASWVEAGVTDERAFSQLVQVWQQDWKRRIAPIESNLPWYAVAKVEEGAFAAFLGFSVNEDGAWQALSVGDCCLFHIQEGRSTSWPLDTPEAFNNTPALIPSAPDHPPGNVVVQRGTWQPGDAFVLATDAAAAWLMRTGPETMRSLPSEHVASRMDAARKAGEIRNDDVTIIVLEMGDPIHGSHTTDH